MQPRRKAGAARGRDRRSRLPRPRRRRRRLPRRRRRRACRGDAGGGAACGDAGGAACGDAGGAPPVDLGGWSIKWLMRANEAIRKAPYNPAPLSRPKTTTAQTTTLLSDVVTVLTGVVPPALMLHFAKTRASVLTVDGDQRFVTTHSTATNQVRVGKLIVDLSSWKNRSYQARTTQARDATPRPPVRRFLRTL